MYGTELERVVLQNKYAAHTQMNEEVGWWDSCYVRLHELGRSLDVNRGSR